MCISTDVNRGDVLINLDRPTLATAKPMRSCLSSSKRHDVPYFGSAPKEGRNDGENWLEDIEESLPSLS